MTEHDFQKLADKLVTMNLTLGQCETFTAKRLLRTDAVRQAASRSIAEAQVVADDLSDAWHAACPYRPREPLSCAFDPYPRPPPPPLPLSSPDPNRNRRYYPRPTVADYTILADAYAAQLAVAQSEPSFARMLPALSVLADLSAKRAVAHG